MNKRLWFHIVKHYSFDPLAKCWNVEIDQQPKLAASRLQVGHELRGMDRHKRIDGFQLNYEAVAHQQIEPAFADAVAFVRDRDRMLP